MEREITVMKLWAGKISSSDLRSITVPMWIGWKKIMNNLKRLVEESTFDLVKIFWIREWHSKNHVLGQLVWQ